MAAILNSANLNSTSWIQPSYFFLWNALTLAKISSHHLHKKKLHSFILTQLDDGSHLEFCHLGFSLLHKTLSQTNSIWLKLIPSHISWYWQPSWILPSWIQLFCTKKLHLFILTQLDDGSDLEFCHIEFRHLDSAILHKTLTQTNSIDSNSFILT